MMHDPFVSLHDPLIVANRIMELRLFAGTALQCTTSFEINHESHRVFLVIYRGSQPLRLDAGLYCEDIEHVKDMIRLMEL